jgi:hypothetical protein
MNITVDRNWIDILGTIWMPAVTCAQRKELRRYDMENIGKPTRKNVLLWLRKNAGDFQHIIDFHAVVGETEIPWKSEKNEVIYYDCQTE